MAQLLNDMLSRQLSSLANPQQLESVCSVIKEEITCSDCNDLCDNTYYNCTDCKLSFCAACAGLGQHQHPLSINQSGKKKKRKTCSEKPITVLTN